MFSDTRTFSLMKRKHVRCMENTQQHTREATNNMHAHTHTYARTKVHVQRRNPAVSKLHYCTHGSKGFSSRRCPNRTTAHTDPRVSSTQTSQVLSDPSATQADPASIPSFIYNTNKKTGWRIRTSSRILRKGRRESQSPYDSQTKGMVNPKP